MKPLDEVNPGYEQILLMRAESSAAAHVWNEVEQRVAMLAHAHPELVPSRRKLNWHLEMLESSHVSAAIPIVVRLFRQAMLETAQQLERTGSVFPVCKFPISVDQEFQSNTQPAIERAVSKWHANAGRFESFETTTLIRQMNALSIDVRLQLQHIFNRSPHENTLKWISTYERTRNARFIRLTPDDIGRMRPGYEKHVITEDMLQYLRKDKIKIFKQHSANGIFVRGFDEPDEDGMTIAKEMERDLEGKAEPGHATYQGRALEDVETGELLTWLTYWQTPQSPSRDFIHRRIFPYLEHGVTGGTPVYYSHFYNEKYFKKHAERLLIFDTIAGVSPGAPSRLLAHAFHDMKDANEFIKYILLYRLSELRFIPQIQKWDFDWQDCANNQKSSTLFTDRDFQTMMYDENFSRKASVPSVTRNVLGKKRRMIPFWYHLYGEMGRVILSSDSLWAEARVVVGDNTDDGLGLIEQPHDDGSDDGGIAI